MARSRKTFRVAALRNMVNERNKLSTCSADTRGGWNSILAQILMDTGNYHGFRYLPAHQLPSGCKPGIRFTDGSKPVFNDTDNTRVEYYEK